MQLSSSEKPFDSGAAMALFLGNAELYFVSPPPGEASAAEEASAEQVTGVLAVIQKRRLAPPEAWENYIKAKQLVDTNARQARIHLRWAQTYLTLKGFEIPERFHQLMERLDAILGPHPVLSVSRIR